MAWKWYGVKTLYRTRAIGKPRVVDRNYDAEGTLVEERVVLIRARNFDEAFAKAEAEAKEYAAIPHGGNQYGQRVVSRYLSACEAFELFDPPAAGREVYSCTRVVPAGVSDAAVARQMIGSEPRPVRMRRKFLDVTLGRAS